MSRIFRSTLALAGLLALASAPAACVHGQPADAVAHHQEAVVGVQVINHGANPVSIALDNGPGRQPLLVLGAHAATSFEVPMRSLAESKVIRLSARELGNARHVARVSARVVAGDQVVWTIEPGVTFSAISTHARELARRPPRRPKPSPQR